jgi:O-antigen ligase
LLWTAGVALVFIAATVKHHDAGPLSRSWSTAPPTIFFLFAVFAVILGATPLSPGGVHPIWSFVDGAGGASIDRQRDWEGGLELLALLLAFLAAYGSGARSRSVRSVSATLIGVGAAFGLVVLAVRIFDADGLGVPEGRARTLIPILSDAGVRGGLFGMLAILALDGLTRAVRTGRGDPKPFAKAAKAAGIKGWPYLIALLIFALALIFTAPMAAGLDAAAMAILFLGWTALTGGKSQDVPRRVALWLVPALAILAGVATVLLGRNLKPSEAAVLSDAAHWSAIQASPWLGYGLGAVPALNNLVMTRTTEAALLAFPIPPNAYFSWLLQGGVLVTLPLLAVLVWIGGAILFASLRPRPSQGLMRAVVCAALFLLLFGLAGAGPSTLPVEALLAVILGLGFGAALTD